MKLTLAICVLVTFAGIGLSSCADVPEQHVPGDPPIIPSAVSDFGLLYAQNCSGCHGANGKGGAAIALGNPVYLAIVDEATLRGVASHGIPGTSMPAFAESDGGLLTQKQIDLIVSGIRQRWSKADALGGADPPPYASTQSGDASRGSMVYATYCQSCHGIGGRGGQKAKSIVDGSFLALLNDQELRTIVIVGRPELGAPDWRNDLPGKPMSARDVSDVVSWLVSQKPQFAGQPYPTNAKSTGEAP